MVCGGTFLRLKYRTTKKIKTAKPIRNGSPRPRARPKLRPIFVEEAEDTVEALDVASGGLENDNDEVIDCCVAVGVANELDVEEVEIIPHLEKVAVTGEGSAF